MNSTRKQVRQAFATLLGALTGVGNPVQLVKNHFAKEFGGQSPVVLVTSAGSNRPQMTLEGSQPGYRLNVYVFVLRGEAGTSYDEEAADDALDDIEAEIAEVIDLNQVTATWQAIDYEGWSRIDPVPIGGEQYWVEQIPLKFEVF